MIAAVAAIQQPDLRSGHSCHREGIAKIEGDNSGSPISNEPADIDSSVAVALQCTHVGDAGYLNLNWMGRESLWTSSRHDFKYGVGIRKGKWKLVLQARHSQGDLEDDLESDREVDRRRGLQFSSRAGCIIGVRHLSAHCHYDGAPWHYGLRHNWQR